MGGLTLLITGAAGYIGRATLTTALAHGHDVIAVVRRAAQAKTLAQEVPEARVIQCDLAEPTEELRTALTEADCVIHCAAAMQDNHGRDTGTATDALLDALPEGAKLVHVSSIAVHDFAALEPGSIVTESAPLETHPDTRDAYAAAKIAQEAAVRAASERKSLQLTILRPGAVFGPGRVWNAHLGKRLGPILLRFGKRGQIPLAHIDLTATALVVAAEQPATDPIMVVGEDLPDRVRYLGALQGGPQLIVPLFPGLLAPLQSHGTRAARYQPLGFDNTRLREVLGVHDTRGFEALMHEAQTGGAT